MFTCMVERDWSIEGELQPSCCEIIRCGLCDRCCLLIIFVL